MTKLEELETKKEELQRKEELKKYLKHFSRQSLKMTACSKKFISLLDNETKEELKAELLQILYVYQGQISKHEQTVILKSLYRLGVRKIEKYKILSNGLFKVGA